MDSADFILEGSSTSGTVHPALSAIAKSMRLLMQARSVETSDHAKRVTALALAVLDRLEPAALEDPSIELGYDLHDIGKVTLPDSVLLKPESLTDDEWETMRLHPIIGAQLLEVVNELHDSIAITIIRHHHERWDGRGYPHGLAGEDIPIACRAFSVVDAYDAMTNDRPYRKAMPTEHALAELRRHAGTQFDSAAVEAFEDVAALWGGRAELTQVS
jgi:HD-GYP domain-containing protein (c-di-GMP phosphodiesterase class II)